MTKPAGNAEVAGLAGSLIDSAISSVALKPMWRPTGEYRYVHPDGTEETVSWFEFSAYSYRDRLVNVLDRLATLKGDDSGTPSSALLDQVDDELRFISDPAGYFWSETTDTIVELPGHQVRRLARVIAPTITSITRLFVREIVPLRPRWTRVVAQPIDINAWLHGARASRVDFLARCGNGTDVHVWDLKTSSTPASEETILAKRADVDARYAAPIRERGFRTHTRIIAATQGRGDAWLTEPIVSARAE